MQTYRITSRFVRPDTATDFPMLTLTDSDYTTRSNNFMTWLGGRSDVTTNTYTSADELTFEFRMDFADQTAADAFTAPRGWIKTNMILKVLLLTLLT